MTTIAQCSYDLTRGGAQRLLLLLVKLRNPNQNQMIVYSFNDGPLKSELHAAGVLVRILPQRLRYFDPSLSLRLRRYFRSDRIDLVHTHLFGATLHAGIAARVLSHIPAVVTIHSDRFNNSRQRLLATMLLNRFDRIVAVGERVSNSLRLDCPRLTTQLDVIPNGVQDLPREARARESSRRRLGIPVDALLVGTVGRLSEVKGHPVLLEAFKQVILAEPSARLVIIGDGPMRQELSSLRRSLGLEESVKFLGEQSHASALLPGLDVFVLPSFWEGLPMALLESMVAGLPCVATAVGSVTEALQDRVNGLLVPPGDPTALAAALLDLIKHPDFRVVLAQKARLSALANYNAARMAARYEELYRNVLA